MSSLLQTRIIPCLLLINESLVKTTKFDNPLYVGDPINTVRIFNELEVDELCFLDIRASVENREPNYKILAQIADECFMPLAYGGGVRSLESTSKILSIGFEKVVINTAAHNQQGIIRQIAMHLGSQAVVASIDVKKNTWGKHVVYINDGRTRVETDPVEWAKELEAEGAGEILLTSIDREGTWSGYDIELTKKITDAISIPVIANGGAGKPEHIGEVIKRAGASAAGLGSMIVYQKKGMGVLINFPDKAEMDKILQ